MTSDVAWHGLSIDAPGPPPADLDRTGAVALIPAADRAFAAAAALTLARSLARHGRRVFLCDLDLAHPRLHVMAGVARDVGVTDFVHYGASIGHVSVELEERLLFVSAGTPVTDHESVFSSERWEELITATTHARACLLLLTPPELPGVEGVLSRAETLVALGLPEECPPLGAHASKLRMGFRPSAGGDVAAAPVAASSPTAMVDDVWAPDPAAMGPDPAAEDGAGATTATTPPRPLRSRVEPERRRRWPWLLLLLLAALAVAIWMEWISVPGISLRQADSSPLSVGPIAGSTGTPAPAEDPAADRGVTGGVEAPEPAAAPTPEGEGAADPAPGAAATVELADTEAPVQGWTLRLGAFRSQSVARQEADRYQALAPDHLFTVVPVDLGDTRWFRVVSAAAVDAAATERQRDLLTRHLAVSAGEAGQWVARSTPFAFLLSDHPSLAEARARAGEVADQGIDAYVLAAPALGGSPRFRVYAGAYADIGEAEAMGRLLAEGGWETAALVERRGTRPE